MPVTSSSLVGRVGRRRARARPAAACSVCITLRARVRERVRRRGPGGVTRQQVAVARRRCRRPTRPSGRVCVARAVGEVVGEPVVRDSASVIVGDAPARVVGVGLDARALRERRRAGRARRRCRRVGVTPGDLDPQRAALRVDLGRQRAPGRRAVGEARASAASKRVVCVRPLTVVVSVSERSAERVAGRGRARRVRARSIARAQAARRRDRHPRRDRRLHAEARVGPDLLGHDRCRRGG